jgi:glycosyltransferase involved in cell wall biosynthesis
MAHIPIVMKAWAGSEAHDFEYIRRSLPSLLASKLPPNARILIFDDCSTDPRLGIFLKEIARSDSRVEVIVNECNKGPNWGQEDAYRRVVDEFPDAPYFVNVDDDVIYNKLWLDRLIAGWRDLERLGIRGVHTALNMPFRPTKARVEVNRRTYLLKWRQPALNWLIPRDVYERVGPFIDEGIAYDTVYSHWLRLHGLAVICMKPSYVQNIGVFGAYAKDDTTTSLDFVGDGDWVSYVASRLHAARFLLRRLPGAVRRRIADTDSYEAPLRWGAEWVFEGRSGDGELTAFVPIHQQLELGWDGGALEARVEAYRRVQGEGGRFALLRLTKTTSGELLQVEHSWNANPNVSEVRRLKDVVYLPPSHELFTSVLRSFETLHDAGIVHNKVRLQNLYIDPATREVHLAWLGMEPPPGVDLLADLRGTIRRLSLATDRRARLSVRERHAVRWLECVAPEIARGGAATVRSDIYSAAAATICAYAPEISTVEELQARGRQWITGVRAENLPMSVAALAPVLSRCLTPSPDARYGSVREVLAELSRTCSVA